MELNRPLWTRKTGEMFLAYLESLSNPEKQAWGKRILNTSLDVLVIPNQKMRVISNTIFQGNYQAFLDLKLFNNYESIALYGMIVSKIRDFDEMKTYLAVYSEIMENWAHCDLLSFVIDDSNKNAFISLSEQYIVSSKVFIRRLGLFILLIMIRDKNRLEYTFSALAQLQSEEEYYVIMMGGWLLSECIIRYNEEALKYLLKYSINPKIVNKGIQKCRESRRLSSEEKDALLIYKIRNKR